jgi:uncharacterized membrane protein required for colicin V production
MAIDIFLFILLVVITALGYRNGFIYTLFHTLGWLISLLIGFVFTPMVKTYMIQSDIFYTSIREQVLLRMPGNLEDHPLTAEGIPRSIRRVMEDMTTSLTESAVSVVTDFLMTVAAFLILVAASKFLLYILIALFSKRNNPGATGIIDGLLGLGMGFIKGFVVVYLVLAIMIPAINLASPDHAFSLLTSLDSSLMAKDLYDNNPLLLLFRN